MSPEQSHTAQADPAAGTWGRIRHVDELGDVFEQLRQVDPDDVQRDAQGNPYVFVRGLDNASCPRCKDGGCVQMVTFIGGARATVLHDPWVLN